MATIAFLAAVQLEGTTVLILLLVVLLGFSFAVSGAEVAFFSLTYKDVNMLKTRQQPAYKRITDLLRDPKSLLASLLIANSFANIAIIIISNVLFDDFFQSRHIEPQWLGFLIKVVSVACVLLLFCEVMPKVMATQNNIRFARDSGFLVSAVSRLFRWMARWMVDYTDIIEKKLERSSGRYSLEELDHAIDLTTDEGTSENEKNILKGVVKFGNITVKQIMKTRVDVHGINQSATLSEVIACMEELHYSRLPVYKESLDEVVGMIHTKDVLPYLDNPPVSFDWHSLLRPPYFVHEQKLIEDLLKDFQARRIHFAVVVDEFGGTSGIATLEDIMEEVIGDIKDEFDEEEAGYRKIDDHTYIFEGRTSIFDVCRIMGIPLDTFDPAKGESDSLAGLVLEVAGDFPAVSQEVVSGAFRFTVLEVEKNRLQRIKVQRIVETV